MLLVAHCCILQHLFLRHHDLKKVVVKSTSRTSQDITKSLLQPMCLSHMQAKFLFPFSQCPLSVGGVQIQTRIPLTWNRNHGFSNSKISILISLTLNISTSIFLDLRQIVYTSQTSSEFSVCCSLNKTRNSHSQLLEKSQLVKSQLESEPYCTC